MINIIRKINFNKIIMNIGYFLSQWCHNTNVKDNLTAIVLEKKLENVGRVCETNTGHYLDTAGVKGSNPVAPNIFYKNNRKIY